MGRLICHMAKRMAKRWQPPVLLSHFAIGLDRSNNVRTNGRTNEDTNSRKRSSSHLTNAHESEPKSDSIRTRFEAIHA